MVIISYSSTVTGSVSVNATNMAITTSASLALNVNASEQARITSSGLGIGTTAPSYNLEINGTSRIATIPISTISTTTLTVTSTSGIYYNITNSGFSGLTLPAVSGLFTGAYWVLRNNTASYLSVTITYGTGGSGITSPISIAPSTSTTVAYSGSGVFVLF